MNLFAALIFGLMAFALLPQFNGDAADAKSDVNCDAQCDSRIELGQTIFQLVAAIGIGVVAGLVPHPSKWNLTG